MTDGFHIAMAVAAGLSVVGGLIAWFTISDDALQAEPKRRGQPPVQASTGYSCALAGPPVSTGSESSAG